jgi:anti-sigma B factor antagonist
MLTTDIEQKGSTTVVRCVGRIVVGEELSQLRDAVLCELDKQTIVLDLRAVEVIDAGGLGLLVFLYTCAHGLGTELKLGARSAQVENVLRLTKLNLVLRLCPDAEIDSGFGPRWEDEGWIRRQVLDEAKARPERVLDSLT